MATNRLALASRARSTVRLGCEQLETRLMPATLVDATTVSYKDADGDRVQIQLSQPLFVDPATADQVCKFDTGNVNGSNVARQQLQELNLAALGTDGLSVKITVLRRSGDGRANVGFINAAGFDVADVHVDGDLGRIEAGAGFFNGGVEFLKVHSLGRLGLSTQAPGGSLDSFIAGDLDRLEVTQDIVDSSLQVEANLTQAHIGGSIRRSLIRARHIGQIDVDGSLLGNPMRPATIMGEGGVRVEARTEFRTVIEVRLLTLIVPPRLADRLLNSSQPIDLETLQAKLARRPLAPGEGVAIQVEVRVKRLVAETVAVAVRINGIDELNVGGRAEYANILGGFLGNLGSIRINGDFRASNISAGVFPGPDGFLGTDDDDSFGGATLEELFIGGLVAGTPDAGDHFGIVAAEVLRASINKKPLALMAGPANDDLPLGTTDDFRLREVGRDDGDGGGPPAP